MKPTKSEITAIINANLREHFTSPNFVFIEEVNAELRKIFSSLNFHPLAANQIIVRLELSAAGNMRGHKLDVILQIIEEAMSDMTC